MLYFQDLGSKTAENNPHLFWLVASNKLKPSEFSVEGALGKFSQDELSVVTPVVVWFP